MIDSGRVVTTFENVDQNTSKLIDEDLKGHIISLDTVSEVVANDEGEPIGSRLVAVCHVVWTGKAPFHPAVSVYKAADLVYLGQESSMAEVLSLVNDLQERLADLEDVINGDDEDDESDDEEV